MVKGYLRGNCMANANTPRPARAKSKQLLERFSGDEELLAKHGVTEDELELLKTVSLFGNLSTARDVAFILENIRGTKPKR
jgi:hypothetical protein